MQHDTILRRVDASRAFLPLPLPLPSPSYSCQFLYFPTRDTIHESGYCATQKAAVQCSIETSLVFFLSIVCIHSQN